MKERENIFIASVIAFIFVIVSISAIDSYLNHKEQELIKSEPRVKLATYR